MKTREGTRANGELAARVAAPTGVLLAMLAVTGVSAQDAEVELWLADAPLGVVLEQVAGRDGVRVVVGEDVEGRIDGRLDGNRETVLATLAVDHDLSVHADGDTVWFDPADRPVVSLVQVAPSEADRALAALEPELGAGNAAQGTDEGLVLSGPRAFVESARRRIAALESTPPGTTRTRRVESVSDIPGYDVDYTTGGES